MKNFFKGISFSSIFAGALAAVTSFLLSAKIGIAGSVIGVAAGSIVSAVATQVYKNVLKASGEKLQNAVPFVTNDKDGTDGDGKSGDDATTVIAPAESEGEQTKTLSAEESDETTVMTSVDGDTTAAMPATSGRVISSAQAGSSMRLSISYGSSARSKNSSAQCRSKVIGHTALRQRPPR